MSTPHAKSQSIFDAAAQFVKRGDFAIDIGASQGEHTIPMALAAGESGLTIALEPNPAAFDLLAKAAERLAPTARIEPHNFAATTSDGQFTFHYSDSMRRNGGFRSQQKWPLFRRRHSLQVQGRNLNYVLKTEYPNWLSRLSYIRLDAQGYDLKVLQSLLPIVAERRPVVRFDVFRKLLPSERYALHDFYSSLKYDLIRCSDLRSDTSKKISRVGMNADKRLELIALPRVARMRAAA